MLARPMRSATLCLLLCAPVAAQNYTVSPADYANHESTNNNAYPFANNLFRYQQVHGDLRGTVRLMQGIAWRRDGTLAANTGYFARVLDAEMFMADSSYAAVSSTYTSNYASTPVNTLIRKTVNLPDHTA